MRVDQQKLKLLPPEALVRTGAVDHADWNYRPLLGRISRARFHLIKKLLGKSRGRRLLEIGYGSGVFLPDLAGYADAVYGADIHDEPTRVAESLAANGVEAELVASGAEKMPWPDDFFDLIVAVSALEFVADLDAVCREVKRLLRPGGRFLVVTPGRSPLLDLGLKIMTGESAKKDFADRREFIRPTLDRHFAIRRELTFPRYGARLLRLYTALELTAKD